MCADSPLFDQIHTEISTVRLKRHDPAFVKGLVHEWNDLSNYMSHRMRVIMIPLLRGSGHDIQPVLKRLRLYEICANGQYALTLFHPVNRITEAAAEWVDHFLLGGQPTSV